jgi:predicted enzyme involved in methoxymalonyl-ACP biosynthesis
VSLAIYVKINNNLLNKLSESYTIGIVSNIIVTQLKPILEYDLRTKGIPATCTIGDYDNIMQDVTHMNKSNVVLIFWEIANLIDGFQYKANLLNHDQTAEYITRFKSEIDYVFAHLKSTPLVLINKFSTLAFNHFFVDSNNFDYICDTLNSYLQEKVTSNMVIIDTGKIISKLSVEKSFDFRDYYSSKSLYTLNFLKNYVVFISPIIAAINGKSKKAIIFDCDNTLWEGIIGEDGANGIKMSSSSQKGVVYEEIQFLAKQLARNGVLIGLNSKNNLNDVEEVFNTHPDISLKNDEIVIKSEPSNPIIL